MTLSSYPLWKLLLVEALILFIAGLHAILLSHQGTKRTRQAMDRFMKTSGSLTTVLLVLSGIALLSIPVTVGLLTVLAKQTVLSAKVILEVTVQLFGLSSLANILLPALVKDLRASMALNLLAAILLVIGAVCGNLFKLYVAENAFSGMGPMYSAVGFVTSLLTIFALLGYALWLAWRERSQRPVGNPA
ncbi:hypothetical protein [Deinococcus phoenicis]|uniref:hypothetical protein n=1 Tax=Deinococcus phoenicis TaxID=1476583 RepID=UPI00054EB48B|nr:hypothetical protein [Deinococcus phoenicis]